MNLTVLAGFTVQYFAEKNFAIGSQMICEATQMLLLYYLYTHKCHESVGGMFRTCPGMCILYIVYMYMYNTFVHV